MLVSLADVKAYIGESGSTYDSFLTTQIEIISDAIEGYCGRKFLSDEYIQTFYTNDFSIPQRELKLFHYPVTSVASAAADSVSILTEIRVHKPSGIISSPENFFFSNCTTSTVIQYTAGYAQASIPSPIKQTVFNLCEEAYNKKKSGIALNFGSDVQRISIPGTISIDFDYTLSSSDRNNAFGSILKNNLNNLDLYRSERVLGTGIIAYVEEA